MNDELNFGNSIVKKIPSTDQPNVLENEVKQFMSDNSINSQITEIIRIAQFMIQINPLMRILMILKY